MIRTALVLVAFTASLVSAQEIWLTKKYEAVLNVDSLLQLEHSVLATEVRSGDERGTSFYYCASIKDLPYPSSSIETVLQELPGYRDRFHYVKQSRGIRIEDRSYFFEIGTTMARSWFVGNYKLDRPDSATCRIALVQNRDKALNEEWRKEKRGFIKVGYKDFQIAWILRRLDDKHTRVALVSYVKPDLSIAEGLFGYVSGKVYPAFLEDLESALSGKKQ